MKYSQKLGGLAALFEAAAYLLGMVFFIVVLDSTGVVEPAQQIALLVNNQLSMQTVILLTYVVFGIMLVLLALALHDRLRDGAPAIMQTATVFGLIWACLLIASGMVYNSGQAAVVALAGSDPLPAVAAWVAIDAVHGGLGGEAEVLGGLWTLLVSWAALRSGQLPRVLNYLGLVVGFAGIASIIPGLTMMVAIFALGQIAWFVWLGILMLRTSPGAAAHNSGVETAAPRPANAAAAR
ncbi:MAG: DUF4386 family protein [Anaerolineales bacterium]|nr:DUF4386 family protein [Anaerolineales bacterium]